MNAPTPRVRDLFGRLQSAARAAADGDRNQLFDLRDGLRQVAAIPTVHTGSAASELNDVLQALVGQLMMGDGLDQQRGLRTCEGLVRVLSRIVDSSGGGLAGGAGGGRLASLPGIQGNPTAAQYLGYGNASSTPISACADSINESRLGHILVRSGEINFDQLDRALAIQKTSNQRLGEVLIAMEAIGMQTLNEALEVQRRETLRLTPGLAKGLATLDPPDGGGSSLRILDPRRR